MARKLPPTDAVIIGLGWTGSILAEQLTAAGLNVVAIERGPWRDTAKDFPTTFDPDELRYATRLDLFLRPAQETVTFRNNSAQTALPIRAFGSFLPGNGVGGAGLHWNGQTWRFLEKDFVVRSHLTERYGAAALPENMTIQDWGVTYHDLESAYDRFEYLAGISGKAGNIQGKLQPGGNVFEGPRARDYPLARWVCTRSPARPRTPRRNTPTRSASPWGRAPIAASASASAAATTPRAARRPPCCRC
jgi:gluconate 2-dehydrogenase alpha chain